MHPKDKRAAPALASYWAAEALAQYSSLSRPHDGLLFGLIALTGSLNVFWIEIDEWLNPALVVKNPNGAYRSLDGVLQSIRAVHPDRKGSWDLRMPLFDGSMLIAWYLHTPEDKAAGLDFGLLVSVNPYTAEVVANRVPESTLVTWIYSLHSTLLLDYDFGYKITGALTMLLILSIFSGIYLWWPRAGKFRQAFSIKWAASAPRLSSISIRRLGSLVL